MEVLPTFSGSNLPFVDDKGTQKLQTVNIIIIGRLFFNNGVVQNYLEDPPITSLDFLHKL